jgi:hypothetical protein
MSEVNGSETRKYEPREQRLCAEFVQKFFPGDRVKFQVRVGKPRASSQYSDIPVSENLAAYNRRPAADALVIRDQEQILIETYIKIDLGKVSQLQIYAKLLPGTPDADWDLKLPLRLMIVGALEDPTLTQHARESGIEFRLFHPPWVDAYFDVIAPRNARHRAPESP